MSSDLADSISTQPVLGRGLLAAHASLEVLDDLAVTFPVTFPGAFPMPAGSSPSRHVYSLRLSDTPDTGLGQPVLSRDLYTPHSTPDIPGNGSVALCVHLRAWGQRHPVLLGDLLDPVAT
ncbi:MAG: hypothetical protein F4191_00605 [Rhodothermaceae bacterium]|nr:hypothetical protein [Rhodothermaceae bacterium]